MEIKKSPKADLQNKRGLLLEIGLAVSLGLCIMMFSWSKSEKVVETFDMGTAKVEEEVAEITRQDEKPPEVKQQTIAVTSDILNIVKDETKITTDFDFSAEFKEDAIIVAQVKVQEEAVAEETPVLAAEVMPSFQGKQGQEGLEAFRNWVQPRLVYPAAAQENGVQGRVTLSFVVEKDGSVGGIKVLQTPDKSLGVEAARVVALSPKWTPATQRGRPVRLQFSLPVVFQLRD